MPQRTAADVMVERLEAWGVPRVFGYSGDGINTFMGALRRAGTVDFVQARHEENAAFMAAGHAKYTGTVGVVTSTQGPGAIHLLNGLYDAKLDGAPVVALVGQQSRSVLGSGYMQEIDLALLMRDVACYRQQVGSAEALPMAMDRAFKAALTHRGPAVVIVPHDVQKLPAAELEHEHGILVTSPQWRPSAALPQAADLQAAADVLNAGRRVALLVGPAKVCNHLSLNSCRAHQLDGLRAIIVGFDLLGASHCFVEARILRTVAIGEVGEKLREIYAVVLEAHDRAIAAIRPGVPLKAIDAAARDYIVEQGFGDYFGHGLGHGVGLEVHEFPTVSPRSADVAEEGMVFTVEPGIYIPELGGVRIEDMVLVTADSCRTLTRLNKNLLVLAD